MSRLTALRRVFLIALVLVLVPGVAAAQANKKKKKKNNKKNDTDVVAMFERGAYQEVIDAVAADGQDAAPESVYLQALSFDGMEDDGSAASSLSRLTALPEGNAWRHIGESALALSGNNVPAAVSSAQRAVESDGGNLYAHYQLGMALAYRRDFGPAAESFRRALEVKGDFAYAHYYAGLSYYRTKNIGPMTTHFERFLELAPEAPERLQVESILRTVRG